MDRLNKTRAFLTEFIIVILFFSLAAVIAINLYVEASQKNDESMLLSRMAMQAQSVAENIRADKDYYSVEGMHTEYLDENMQVVNENEATYVQKIIVTNISNENITAGKEYQYDILILAASNEKSDKEALYTLTIRQYVSMEVQ